MGKKLAFESVDPKPDFAVMEKKLINKWYKEGIVRKYLAKNTKSAKKFSFLDGPITANNPMGIHHAWGRTYKDLWQRFYNMLGYKQRFQNGFDEQGLWVEVEVEKELGFKNKKDIEKFGIDKFVIRCKERVRKFSRIQTEQSKRLGYFMDWDNSYHTSSDKNNYAIWHFLKDCHEKGYLYKGRDSVPWCPRCGTAISQHEILTEEYQEVTHKAVFVKYPVLNENYSLLVWTTTPWTLPSNVAIAVNPNFFYRVFTNNKTNEKVIIVEASHLPDLEYQRLIQRIGLLAPDWEIKRGESERIKGQKLVGKKYRGPFDDLPAVQEALKENFKTFHTIVSAKDLVTAEEGTGLVHIAPGAGEKDFDIAQGENLPIIASIDESANYIEGFGDLTGRNAKEDPDLIIKKLNEKGAFFKVEDYPHRYPVCWRCKTELVWRVVDEWYIAMDRPAHKATDDKPSKNPSGKSAKTLRQQMMDVAKKINWIPKFGLERELDWLKNMDDWLISKKRYWGLALPIWECYSCGNFEVIGSKEELEKRAVEGWEKFKGNSPHRPWIDRIKIKCSVCQSVASRIPDVGNPWLDAGIVPFSTLPKEWFPADFITESFPGQFKNWFYSLIAMSTVLENTNSFKIVLGFATLLDEKGEEMHKSKGNAIEFNEAADKIGVDVMRWLYLSQNPVNNLLFGYHRADEVRRRFYLILWNTYVFFNTYANLDNWKPSKTFNSQPLTGNILDQWIISRFNSKVETVTNVLGDYNAQAATTLIEHFVIDDLSTWYIRRSRDRLGLVAHDQNDKNECYQTLYFLLVDLARLLAPFLPFVADEIYTNLTSNQSVHLSDFPKINRKLINLKLEKTMHQARQLVEKVHALRKEAKIKIRQPLSELVYGSSPLPKAIEKVVADEVNVKKVLFKKASSVKLNLKITSELKKEGQAREIIRQIQQLRKEAGCDLDEKIIVHLPSWPFDFEEEIKRETLSTTLVKSEKLAIRREH